MNRSLVLWEPAISMELLDFRRDELERGWRFILSKGWLITAVYYHPTYIILSISKLFQGLYHDAWIYDHVVDAALAFALWNPVCEKEPRGWYRHPSTGRRREYNEDGSIKREWIQW